MKSFSDSDVYLPEPLSLNGLSSPAIRSNWAYSVSTFQTGERTSKWKVSDFQESNIENGHSSSAHIPFIEELV